MPITINGSGTVTGISAGGLPSGVVTETTLSSSAISYVAPPGAVCYVAQNTAPSGWLKANGAAVSRTAYATLFAALGTTFGAGNGSTTFNLPDLRGEFPRGWDDSRGVDSGRAFGSAQADAFSSHIHTTGQTGTGLNGSISTTGATVGVVGGGAQTTGTTGSTETRPRNIALLAIIKF